MILNLPGSARRRRRGRPRVHAPRERAAAASRRRRSAQMPRWKYKEIIFAVLHVQEMQSERRNEDGSPVGPPDYEYTLDVSYHPLDYIELIVWFAFEEKVFLIIFFIAGFLTILISVILWTSVRLTTMLENPPRVRIWSTLLLIVVPPFQGVRRGVPSHELEKQSTLMEVRRRRHHAKPPRRCSWASCPSSWPKCPCRS